MSRYERYLNDTGIVVFFLINIIRKINTGIRYEPVYRPALVISIKFDVNTFKNVQR